MAVSAVRIRVWRLKISRFSLAFWERGSSGGELGGVDCIVKLGLGIAVTVLDEKSMRVARRFDSSV
jgi:hypothetical protein